MASNKRKKKPRNCYNETQQRCQKHGRFIRRHDDASVEHFVSRSAMFREANAAAKQRSTLARCERQARNAPRRLLEQRHYDQKAARAWIRPAQPLDYLFARPLPGPAPAPRPRTREELQAQRDRARCLARIKRELPARRRRPKRKALVR